MRNFLDCKTDYAQNKITQFYASWNLPSIYENYISLDTRRIKKIYNIICSSSIINYIHFV